uniref:(northern house mosquito) hypothetical protein n=1 Tax=Culex pipiens TaxID=7175 RepID=A0A8D8K6X2_CULPI
MAAELLPSASPSQLRSAAAPRPRRPRKSRCAVILKRREIRWAAGGRCTSSCRTNCCSPTHRKTTTRRSSPPSRTSSTWSRGRSSFRPPGPGSPSRPTPKCCTRFAVMIIKVVPSG